MDRNIIKMQSELIELQKELIKLLREKIVELEKRSRIEYVPVSSPIQPCTPIGPAHPRTTGNPIPNWNTITTSGMLVKSDNHSDVFTNQPDVSYKLKKFLEES